MARFAVLVALALVGCAPSSSSIDAGLDARLDAPRADAPRIAVHDAECASDAGAPEPGLLAVPGPYLAGVRTVSIHDAARDRTLPLEVWYPVDPAAPGSLSNAYFVDYAGRTLASMCSPARRDAPPLEPGTARPLVVFSHGFGGIRFQSFFLAEHLASHGFVVAAPDHVGNTIADLASLSDPDAEAVSTALRPPDVLFTLDRMLEDGAGTGLLVDASRIAVAGHSFGAWTAIEVARLDPRVAVVVSLAPGFHAPSTPDLAGMIGGRPLFLMGGSVDATTPFEEQDAAYAAAVAPKLLVRIEGAGHLDFSDLCRAPSISGFFDDGCDPASLEPAIARDLTAYLGERFLTRYLLGDTSADPALEPAAIETLGHATAWRAP